MKDQNENKVDLEFVANLAIGGRPSGGPYEVAVQDGQRFLTAKDYKVLITCTQYFEDEEHEVMFHGWVWPSDWKEELMKQISS